jgi:hypothetical protein
MFCEFTAKNPEFNRILEEYKGIISEISGGDIKKISYEASVWYGRFGT